MKQNNPMYKKFLDQYEHELFECIAAFSSSIDDLNGINEDEISCRVVDDVGYPILLDVFSNMGFGALIFSSLIPIVHMGGLMVFAMLSTSFGTLTILAAIMEMTKHTLKR